VNLTITKEKMTYLLLKRLCECVCAEIDHCSPNPCLNGGSCTSYPAVGYICACATGYNGTNCSSRACLHTLY